MHVDWRRVSFVSFVQGLIEAIVKVEAAQETPPTGHAMYEIDPSRTDLAEEFKAQPFGHHSPELQMVLNRMRSEPIKGRYVIVYTGTPPFTLAQLPGVRGMPPTLTEYTFSDLGDAEWFVFKLRWKKLTGHELPFEQ